VTETHRIGVRQKMRACDHRVSGDDQLLSFGRRQHCRVVTDAHDDVVAYDWLGSEEFTN